MQVPCIENYITSLPENNNQEFPLMSVLTNSESSIYPLSEKDPWFGTVSFCSWSNWSYDCYWGGRHSQRFLPIGTRAANYKQASAHYNLHEVLIIQPSRESDRDLRELWSDWGMPEPRKVSKKGSKKTAPKAFKSSKRKRKSRKESYSIHSDAGTSSMAWLLWNYFSVTSLSTLLGRHLVLLTKTRGPPSPPRWSRLPPRAAIRAFQ